MVLVKQVKQILVLQVHAEKVYYSEKEKPSEKYLKKQWSKN